MICFVACAPGLEAVLGEELRALRVGKVRPVPGGAEVDGPPGAYRVLNRWSRLASRVLLRIATVDRPEALARLSLAEFLPDGAGVRLEVTGSSAWAQVARRVFPKAAEGEAGVEPLGVWIRVVGPGRQQRAQVSVDTSGELLHFRGARQEVGRAPVRETLAAGVLALAGWSPTEPLWDVMCGSGTFLIEAAERALGLAPGRQRRFAYERFPVLPEEPTFEAPHGSAPPVLGSDLNAGALGTARRNARRAHVLEHLSLERLDATALPQRPHLPPGLVVANLPYGRRVGDRSELASLYGAVGRAVARALPRWRFAFLLAGGAQHLDLPITARFPLKNGGLDCEVVSGSLPPAEI